MHDIDRTLAELAVLDGATQETDFEFDSEFEDEADLEDFEDTEEFEFEPEAEDEFGAEEWEAGPESESAYDLEGEFEDEEEGDFEFEPEAEWEDEEEGDLEFDTEAYASGTAVDFESALDGEGEFAAETMDEMQELELAAELLEVQDEHELDHLLGGLLGSVAAKFGKAFASPTGKKLLGQLKKAAKKALPGLGTAIGTVLGGPAGAALGADISKTAGQLLGLELEGLAPEDQELEAAKAFVRFAADAARRAAQAAPGQDAELTVHSALVNAAQRHAPGLLMTDALGPGRVRYQDTGRRASGRWVRVGRNQVVLHGI